MLVQSQQDIDRLDGGASAYVYAVNTTEEQIEYMRQQLA